MEANNQNNNHEDIVWYDLTNNGNISSQHLCVITFLDIWEEEKILAQKEGRWRKEVQYEGKKEERPKE